jgi:hypothetical protein
MLNRRRALVGSFLVVAVASACGGGGASNVASPTTSASASSSTTSTSAAPTCTRMCTVEKRCGGDVAACERRCDALSRVVTADVVTSMVDCVDKGQSKTCGASDKAIVRECVVKAFDAKKSDAEVNVGLFAKTFCDRQATCAPTASKSAQACLDEAKEAIQATASPEAGSIYGALRPSIVDEIVVCMKQPCDKRKDTADAELDRCLDEVLSSAVAPP